MQVDPSKEPRWVTKVFRLFPHPLFAALIGLACLAVATIFILVAATQGVWFMGIIGIAFGSGAYCIFAAIIIRRRGRRLEKLSIARGEESEARDARVGFGQECDLRGLPPVPTRHLLLYLATMMVWEAKLGVFLLGSLGNFQPPMIWRALVTLLSLLLTFVAFQLGWADYQRLRRSCGKIELTRGQAALVVGLLISFSMTFVVVFEVLKSE